MCLGRSSGRTWARRTLYRQDSTFSRKVPQPRQHIVQSSHICRFLLYPDNFPSLGISVELRCEFGFREWVELLDEDDSNTEIFFLSPLDPQFMADFPGAEKNSPCVTRFRIRTHFQEIAG